MKRATSTTPLIVVLLISLFLATTADSQPQEPPPPQNGVEYVDGEVIIKFKETAGPTQVSAVFSELQATLLKPLRLIRAELWRIDGISVEEAVARYKNDPRVEYIEPNYIYHAFDTFPNDPRFGELWGMHNTGQLGGVPDADIDAPEAWDIATGDRTVLVGVIDTGVDYTHEDLIDNIWTNPGEIPGNGIDDDGNGYVDDYHGWDFAYGDNDPMDGHSHGTHVSGTIGATGDNGIGVAGVCWQVKILPIKFLSDGGSGATADAVLSVEYGTMMGVKLTNNSWGGGAWSQALKDAIAAADSAGILFIASAGNGYTNTDYSPVYPACYEVDNVISVANIQADDQLRPSSNYGVVTVDLGAPGTDILSTMPGDYYATKSGTSMASPHVAGAAALLWSVAPHFTHDEVKNRIFSSVEPTPVLSATTATGGRLNIFNMLNGLDSIPPDPVNDLDVAEMGSSTVTLTFTASGDDSTAGTAKTYDMRFSTLPINEGNFDSATPFADVPAPQASGTTEAIKLKGLDFNTRYYFALKVMDEMDNVSPLSNVVSDSTLDVPGLAFTPQTLLDSLFTGGTTTRTVNIRNMGQGTLDFEFLNLDEPGAAPDASPGGQDAISWLAANPREGTLYSGESVNVEIAIDGTGLNGGQYTAIVELATNDPLFPLSTLFIRLDVTCAPDIAVTPESLDFGQHFQGATVTGTAAVTNGGCNTLNVTGVTIDHADYTAGPTAFVVAPGQFLELSVQFHPTSIGVIPATLTIHSDDPYEPELTVPLTGEGVVPPDISVAPPLMVEALSTGEAADHTFTISNSGGAALEWALSFEDSATSVTRQYTLTTPPLTAQPPEKDAPVSRPRAVRSSPATVVLQDLTGKRIMWDMSHGQSSPGTWSTIISDLTARGATLTENYDPISPELLDGYDVLWTVDAYTPWTAGELAAMRNWLAVKGAILIESDQNTAYNNLILDGLGIIYAQLSGASGITTNIYPHPITKGVSSVYIQYPLSHLSIVEPPAVRLVDDVNGEGMCAATRYGGGRVVALAEEILNDYSIGDEDNQRFGNQIFDWLVKSVSWLSADTTNGSVAGYSSQDLNITFDAAGLEGGTYEADLVVISNDPDDPQVTSRAVLVVTAAPDINLTGHSFDFGDVFIGAQEQRSLFVMNNGVVDLSVSHILSSNADYSVNSTSMVVPPGEIRPLTITFAPTLAGPAPAVLSVVSNDPDESVVEISVAGSGLVPPVIETDPDVFIANLRTGGTDVQTLNITNAGVTDLDWEIEVEGLTRIGYLRGLKILYDRTHGQEALDPGLVAALEIGGATVTSSFTPITRALLDQHDVFLFKNVTIDFMYGQITDLAAWIHDGGDIVFLTDEAGSIGWANQLVRDQLAVGFAFESVPMDSGFADVVDPVHPVTYNIYSFFMPHRYARLVGVQSPATALAHAGNGDVVGAISDLGEGRIVAVCDDVDSRIANEGSRRGENWILMLQALAWAGADYHTQWLEVSPASGSTGSGNTVTPTVTFEATGLGRDTHQANIIIHSNDPLEPEVTIPAFLGVLPAADIYLSADSVDFGVTFTAVTVQETLVVYNMGPAGDALSNFTVTGSAFDVINVTDPFTVAIHGQRKLILTFNPAAAGPHTGTLTFESLDPDTPVLTVYLRGEGVDPPVISVSPASLDETLLSGETSVQSMYVNNTGSSDLIWSLTTAAADSSLSPLKTYALNLPPADAPPPAGEAVPDAASREIRLEPVSARLRDLAGVKIMWEQSHGQVARYNRSTIMNDLTARGATVTDNNNPITLALLEGYDIIWTVDANYLWSPEEALAIKAFIHEGGAMLFESDQSQGNHNRILNGTGLEYSVDVATAGFTTNIYLHNITDGVLSVWLGGPLAQIGNMYAPAVRLFDDVDGRPTGAATLYGAGRIVVVADELFDDYSITSGDNQILGNQTIDWLAGATWLTVEPSAGTLAAGATDTLSAFFDASTVVPDYYLALATFSSNDPVQPELVVPVSLNIIPAPDISVPDTLLDFGTVFTGQTNVRQLRIRNVGFDALSITAITTSDADFSTAVDSVTIPAKTDWLGDVIFAPNRVGSIGATLTIFCDDPDEPQVEVALSGRGVDPPVVTVTPDSLRETLYAGGTASHSLYVGNAGVSDLEWIISVLPPETGGIRTYTLSEPPADASPPDKEQPAAERPRHADALTADLRSVDGLKVMWERSHGQQPLSSWSTMRADLASRGATVTENFDPLTPARLSAYDVIWMADVSYGFTPDELLALHEWVFNGGSLLIESDESETYLNAVLTGTGIQYINWNATAGSTTIIYPHKVTEGVTSVWLNNPLAYFGMVQSPAFRLVDDSAGLSVGAATMYGAGRVVAFADEVFSDYGLGDDNQLLGNQVFGWFSNLPWLSITPEVGTTSGGEVDTVTVTFDAVRADVGLSTARLVVHNNDPGNPDVEVPVALEVISAPDIVSDPRIDFGAVYVGVAAVDNYVIRNEGTEDLVITSFDTDDPDYLVGADSLRIPPHASASVDVEFRPSRADTIPGTLTIFCNDPDESVYVVLLSGRGMTPPTAVVSPDTLREALFTGETATHAVYVSNTGGSDLGWLVELVSAGTTLLRSFTLTLPPEEAAPPEGEQPAAVQRTVKTDPLRAQLHDLTGTRIMWERAHGQGASSGWSTIIADLTARGATVADNFSAITPQILDGYDLVWTIDAPSSWAPTEVSAIRDWIFSGGALIIESDQYESKWNDVLAGTGIVFSGTNASSGMTTRIFPHDITKDVTRFSLGGPLAHLSSVTSPAEKLVEDINGRIVSAAAAYGTGRIAAFTDEVFSDYSISNGDNQLLGNQAVDWLSGALAWISVDPVKGTTAAGSVDTLTVIFDGTMVPPDLYEADIRITSNDPLTPVANVAAILELTGIADIAVPDTLVDFGTVILGASSFRNVVVYNQGNHPLIVSDVATNDSTVYIPAARQFVVGEGMNYALRVDFMPAVAGTHADTLKIVSNDPDEGVYAVPLTGNGIEPPDIVVAPDSLSEALYVGESSVQTLTITNTAAPGAHDLDFVIRLSSASAEAEEIANAGVAGEHGNDESRSRPITGVAAEEDESGEDQAVLPWLSVNIPSGTISPGNSRDIEVTFDANGIYGGDYAGIITIGTNVPGKEEVVVPVTLDATGIPLIALSDSVLAFGDVYLGYPQSLDLVVSNAGTDVLSVSALGFDQPGFSADPVSFDLQPARNQTVAVTYSPPAAGPVSAIMTVTSNDTTQAGLEVHLTATGLEPPVIELSPESLYVAIDEGDSLTETFRITNSGGSALNWTGRIVDVPSPAPVPGIDRLPARRSGIRILWYGDHGFGNTAGWSILIGDLAEKGGTVTEFYDEVTYGLLSQYHILWLGNLMLPLASSELQAIAAWVRFGGSLLIEADNDLSRATYQTLLTLMSANISYSTGPALPGYTTNIFRHEITEGVSRLYLPNPYRFLYVTAPADTLFGDGGHPGTNFIGAVEEIQNGRLVVLTDQMWRDGYIHLGDNRVLGNNVFDWLANFAWTTLVPDAGTIAAGGDAEVGIFIDGALAIPGAYHRYVSLMSNDPATPTYLLPLDIFVRELRTVSLVLDAGYNLRSWNVDTDVDSTISVLGPIVNELINARGFDGGGLVFDPDIPPQFNTLATMDHLHGYWLDMEEARTLSLTGGLVDHQTPMPLDVGYNLIGYLPQAVDSVGHALGTILDDVRVVLGYDGGGLTFDPTIPPEFNTLQLMKPGYGYWVRLDQPATLVYPLNPVRSKSEGLVVATGGPVKAGAVSTGEKSDLHALDRPETGRGSGPVRGGPAAVAARGEPGPAAAERRATRAREWISVWGDDIVIGGMPLPVGTVITAVDPDGVVCGEFEVKTEAKFGLMAIYRDDPETDADEGARPGDEITIMIGDLGVFEGVRWTAMGDVIKFNDVATMTSSGRDQLPRKYALYQNYPNPFNPVTTIKYDLRDAGDVTLTIYNIRGERVRDLVDRYQGAGRYAAEWDGTNNEGRKVASGVYFFKLVAGDFVKTKKMILLK